MQGFGVGGGDGVKVCLGAGEGDAGSACCGVESCGACVCGSQVCDVGLQGSGRLPCCLRECGSSIRPLGFLGVVGKAGSEVDGSAAGVGFGLLGVTGVGRCVRFLGIQVIGILGCDSLFCLVAFLFLAFCLVLAFGLSCGL